jgi:hypothetical protein
MGRVATRRWITTPLVVVASALVWSASGLAAPSEVPAISNLHAQPNTFCAKASDSCKHPGTTLRFTVSTAAKVRADARPRFKNTGGLVEFVRRFPQGTNTVRINDARLTPGTWVLRLQGTNAVGTGGIAVIHVHVVKHG